MIYMNLLSCYRRNIAKEMKLISRVKYICLKFAVNVGNIKKIC